MPDTPDLIQDAKAQFRKAMADKGITPPEVIETDGKRHRFSSNGKPGDDAGWYIFHNGAIPSGSFGDFHQGNKSTRWIADLGRRLTSEEKLELQTYLADLKTNAEAAMTKARAEAKSKAVSMLSYSKPASPKHPYLRRKGIGAHGLRTWKNLLLVPMIDDSGQVQSLQLISGDGDKKFLAGGKMQGCFHTLGTATDPAIILIAEGFATAATINEATNLPTIVAYNAGNLKAVARTIRKQNPTARIIICADDDYKTEGNPGITKATQAAAAIDAEVVKPEFGPQRPDGATDFNDMAAYRGKKSVKTFFDDYLSNEQTRFATLADSAEAENTDDEFDAFISRPNALKFTPEPITHDKEDIATKLFEQFRSSYQNYRTKQPSARIEQSNNAEHKLHFAAEDYTAVQNIWNSVPRKAAYHTEAGYHLYTDEKRKVIVTRDEITLAKKPRHRPDEGYLAACDHARQFWDGKMVVRGDNPHCIKAWAYAQVNGIQVMNYEPRGNDRVEAERIMKSLQAQMTPGFSRPSGAMSPSMG